VRNQINVAYLCAAVHRFKLSVSLSMSTIAEDVEDMDTLFNKITRYDYHILQSYLPESA